MNLKELVNAQEEQQPVNLKKVNLLVLLLNFEKYWQSYSLSDGEFYYKDVRAEAKKIVLLFYEIYGKKVLVNPDRTINDDGMFMERQFVEELEKWINTKDKFPKVFLGKDYSEKSQFYYQIVLMELYGRLEKELKLPVSLSKTAMPHEQLFRMKQKEKWKGQIPETIIKDFPNPALMMNMSQADTLVVVGDIRRSQELMTYGESPNYYREQIVKFIKQVRKIVLDANGIFDKFTGDGFIVYFNQYVCELTESNCYQMMLKACREIQSYSEEFFDEWSKQIRKVPVERIGLSIGIDSGKVNYKVIDNQLYAIGDACVWATRMCDAGQHGSVVFNNIPYHRISPFGREGFSKEIISTTKNGESFGAFDVDPTKVDYQMPLRKDPSIESPSAIS